ncbi:hypothetical protein GGS20DRAFT_545854 [Poronia punctata]|nr:hypothetical protein GGS20DRAFT_545854 [Poronia punctata]
MRFAVATVLAFAFGVMAAPSPQGIPSVPGDVTVGQAGDTCGRDFELSCCNKVKQTGDTNISPSGLLAGLLAGTLADGDLDLFGGCSKLDVAALIGVDDLLNSHCKQTAACCQHSGTSQDGLVNVGLPCVALGGLL